MIIEEDPRAIIARTPMHVRQIVMVGVAAALNALDGFDVQSIAFAAPGIARDWGIDRAALGLVLSMELIGMGFGGLVLGSLADRIGRRPTILACLFIMAAGMGLAAGSDGVARLSAVRLVTGLGIGGMLTCTAAIVAECSSARSRNVAIAVMAGGYPVGATIGGALSATLLATTGRWQSIFILGCVATVSFIPIVLRLVPETIAFLVVRRPRSALSRINRTLALQDRAMLSALPAPDTRTERRGLRQAFAPGQAKSTVLITASYFLHMMSFYFFMKWIPKLVVDFGYRQSSAADVLVAANLGAVMGCVLMSLAIQRVGLRTLVVASMLGAFVAIALFGRGAGTLAGLSLIAALGGFFTNAATCGLYAVIAQGFPTEIRAGATGLVIGVGRGGAALGPIAAGVLLTLGVGLAEVATALGSGTAIAALLLLLLRYRNRQIA